MIHAVCNFCGKDCDRVAYFMTIQPFQNFPRYCGDTELAPNGMNQKKYGFVICQKCLKKHKIPSPHIINRAVIPSLSYDDCCFDNMDLEDDKGWD